MKKIYIGADHAGFEMKKKIGGFLLVQMEQLIKKDLGYWIGLALDFNKKVKASKRQT